MATSLDRATAGSVVARDGKYEQESESETVLVVARNS